MSDIDKSLSTLIDMQLISVGTFKAPSTLARLDFPSKTIRDSFLEKAKKKELKDGGNKLSLKKGATRAVRARNKVMYKAEQYIKKELGEGFKGSVDTDYREGKRTIHINKTELVYTMTHHIDNVDKNVSELWSGRFSHFNK